MARRTPPKGSWITACLVFLGLNFLASPTAGPQGALQAAFAAKKAPAKAAGKKAAVKAVAKKEDAASAPPPPKRPLSAYMLWLKKERPSIVKALGDEAVPAVGKEAGKRWGKLSKKAKAPFEDEAADLREDYQSELEDFIAKYGQEAAKRAKKVKKPKKDPNAPKRPGSGYTLWVKDNHSKLKAKLPSDSRATEVMVQAAKEWGKVSAAVKAKYKKTYEKQMQEYTEEKAKYLESLVVA